jgi:hypothetical protein
MKNETWFFFFSNHDSVHVSVAIENSGVKLEYYVISLRGTLNGLSPKPFLHI